MPATPFKSTSHAARVLFTPAHRWGHSDQPQPLQLERSESLQSDEQLSSSDDVASQLQSLSLGSQPSPTEPQEKKKGKRGGAKDVWASFEKGKGKGKGRGEVESICQLCL
jgi:hypothetical protein